MRSCVSHLQQVSVKKKKKKVCNCRGMEGEGFFYFFFLTCHWLVWRRYSKWWRRPANKEGDGGGGSCADITHSVCRTKVAMCVQHGCNVCAAWRAATWRCCITPSQTSTSCTCMRAASCPSSLPTAASGLCPLARTISSTPGELHMAPAFSRSEAVCCFIF